MTETSGNQYPVLKVVMAGDGNVGKTSLVRRFCEGKFSESRVTTIGVDFQTKVVQLPEGTVKLSIWDMAGQERFKVVRSGFYRGSLATALVYDVTEPDSVNHLPDWYEEIREAVPDQNYIIVGNKSDLERNVSSDEAKAFAEKIGGFYLETSALNGDGVGKLFFALAGAAASRMNRS